MTTQTLLDEIAAGQAIYLATARLLFPRYRLARPVTSSCVFRWTKDGVRGPDGQRVRLEAARLAGRWVTTRAAIARFIAAQTPRLDTHPAPAPRASAARQRASERAAQALDELGL
jgi:hypothetical protein